MTAENNPMKCSKCGTEADQDSRFCLECGTLLDRFSTASEPQPRVLRPLDDEGTARRPPNDSGAVLVNGQVLATPWRRFGAALVEFVAIPFVIMVVLTIAGIVALTGEAETVEAAQEELGVSGNYILSYVYLGLGIANAVAFFFVSRAGHSPVKLWLGMKVMNADGTYCRWTTRFGRDVLLKWGPLMLGALLNLVLGVAWPFHLVWGAALLLSFGTAFGDKTFRAFHDRLFDTIVVRFEREPKPTR